MSESRTSRHSHPHAFAGLNPLEREGLVVGSRRNMLKAGLAGMAGLSLPDLLRQRARASEAGRPIRGNKAVILLWMAGGPSQIDTWDPKPDRPLQNRGPFGVIPTKLPGVSSASTCRSRRPCSTGSRSSARSTARHSNHEPNKVFQTGNLEAAPRINPAGDMYPAIGSIVAKHHGPNQPGMPALRGVPDVAVSHRLRRLPRGAVRPVHRQPRDPACRSIPTWARTPGGSTGADFFRLPAGAEPRTPHGPPRPAGRTSTACVGELDRSASRSPRWIVMASEAIDLLVGRRAREAFDLSREPRGGPGPLRKAPLVPAGAAGPPAGRGRASPSSRST